MNETNYIKLEFPSRSSNEGFARAAAAFAAQRPEHGGAGRYPHSRIRGGDERHRPRLSRYDRPHQHAPAHTRWQYARDIRARLGARH